MLIPLLVGGAILLFCLGSICCWCRMKKSRRNRKGAAPSVGAFHTLE
jgi:hypothetical protein